MYILVVGFHHKKGCQIEFSYPELQKSDTDDTIQPPSFNWKHLASLALPDGSHNYDEDFVYFHLVDDRNDAGAPSTIYGISCYRQMSASELHYADAEVTRATVQKSVCVLTRRPLYGALKIKLSSITQAYFEQRNFKKTDILVNAFHALCNSFKEPTIDSSNYYMGISLSDLIVRYEHKILLLFKLMLLEKNVLYFMTPVGRLSNTIIGLVSLLPGVFETTADVLRQSALALNLNELNEVVFFRVDFGWR